MKKLITFSTIFLFLLSQNLLGRNIPSQINKIDIQCDLCESVIGSCKLLLEEFKHEEKLLEKLIAGLVETTCKAFQVETDEICHAIVKLFSFEFFHSIQDSKNLSTKAICSGILGCNNGGENLKEMEWNINIPPINRTMKKVYEDKFKEFDDEIKKGVNNMNSSFYILQLTDLHIDELYVDGSCADCNEPLCCHLNSTGKCRLNGGYYGSLNNCDVPLRTYEGILQHIQLNHQEINSVYLTGDIPSHHVWNQFEEKERKLLRLVSELLKKYLPNKTVYSTIGNHESVPVNSFPTDSIKETDMKWMYSELANDWTSLGVSNESYSSILHFASYSTQFLNTSHKIISINMNNCNQLNFWLYAHLADPMNELKWLVDELIKSESLLQRVHIIGHIYPGGDSCLRQWSANYARVIERFQHVITAQFFAHSHTDWFEVFLNEIGAYNIAYVAPSITTYSFLNPGYRIYQVDMNSFHVVNHFNYVMNLTESNEIKKIKINFEYDAKSAYNLTNLLPSSWHLLAKEMLNNSILFNKFYSFKSKLSPVYPSCQTKECIEQEVCALLSAQSYNKTFCPFLSHN
ncbi:hypothetical protein SNEBB_006858 [Seison nebaliae]|nr:hypothetical protein SNEBB_006858 [Seison nebaliae]